MTPGESRGSSAGQVAVVGVGGLRYAFPPYGLWQIEGGATMSVELNHTIIPARDRWQSAKFLAEILNLEAGPEWGHFVPIRTNNGVTLDFSERDDFRPGHYAFLVG